eukprot:554374-Rhodomonas_salina.1
MAVRCAVRVAMYDNAYVAPPVPCYAFAMPCPVLTYPLLVLRRPCCYACATHCPVLTKAMLLPVPASAAGEVRYLPTQALCDVRY